MKRWLGMGMIAVALIIAACGGDDDGGNELTVQEYFSQLQTISNDVNAE